jgi:hypothetical protein
MKASDVIRIGPQPQARGFDAAGEAVASLLLELPRELHDQDRVLCRKADQHHEADLGQDIVVLPAQAARR